MTVNGVDALHLTEQIFPVTINCIRTKQSKPKAKFVVILFVSRNKKNLGHI